jgi:hypothetical protein
MKGEMKIDTCIIWNRKVQPAENWVRCHLWGGFASFHWLCFGEYLHADSEQQVESVVWKASSTPRSKTIEAEQQTRKFGNTQV